VPDHGAQYGDDGSEQPDDTAACMLAMVLG
jgi:hypothetical protein